MSRLGVLCAAVAVLILVSVTDAEVHTISATGEYRMGDNDTRTDAKRLALLNAERLALEQVGTYVESISEVRNMQLTRDEIRSYTAGIVKVKEVRTRAELDKDGQSTIIYVDVVCEIDSEVLARQMENLRRSESTSREMNTLRAENERLRGFVVELSRTIPQTRTKAEQERLITQRQEILKNIYVNELLRQAWVVLAGSTSSLKVGSSSRAGREDARRLITQAFTIDPKNANAHFFMGALLHEDGDLNGAINAYRQAIGINPDLAEAHNGLGNALKDRGDLDGAISEYQQSIKIKPDLAQAHSSLGVALVNKGDLKGAIQELRVYIRLSTDEQLKQKAIEAVKRLQQITEALIKAAREDQIAIVQGLLSNGADVNVKDEDGNTALIIAAIFGHNTIAQILLANGADVNAKDNDGKTALMWAAFNGQTAIVRLLLSTGADVNIKDNFGKTALMKADSSGNTDIVKLLKNAGAKE